MLTENNRSEVTSRTIKKRLENEKRFLITIAIVCGILAVTLVPEMVNVLVFGLILPDVGENMIRNPNSLGIIIIISILLLSVNCAVNPFVYFWRLPKYKKTLKKMYCK